MSDKNMTALINCFLKAYHYNRNVAPVFRDELAEKLLMDDYDEIAKLLTKWISFIDPSFNGTDAEALYIIAEHCLAPAVVARSAFCKDALYTERRLGCKHYLIFGAGYDTYAYTDYRSLIKVFELDTEETLCDKIRRCKSSKLDTSQAHYISCNIENKNWTETLLESNFDPKEKSFCSLMGITQYNSKDVFANLLENISSITPSGSALVFDYHCGINIALHQFAEAAGKQIKSVYSYREMEALLSKKGFRIYENIDSKQITERYFKFQNLLYPHNKIEVGGDTAFCLAIKK